MAEALSRRKVALVTGGTRGIGHGIAENLAREGFDLILGYLKDDESARLTKLKFEKEYQAKVSLVKGDILLPETLEHFFKELETNHSNRLDALIHNAGTAHVSRVPGLATCLDSYDAAQEMYPKFFIRVVEKAIKVMHKGEGRIVAISSQGVHNPSPSFAVGAAAKAAMEVIAKHYAFVLAPLGITVNVVVPGFVRTDAWEPYLRHSNLNETPALVTPMGRWGFPSDVSPLVTFLCSSEARWITGQIIQIDGGFGMSLFESVATVEKVVGSMASADHSSGTRARRSTLTDNKTPSINTLLEKTRETMLERNKETLRQKLEKLALKKEEKDEAPEDKEKEKEKDKGSAEETAK